MGEFQGGRRGGKLFDDLAGVAGGAFSVLTGMRAEAEAMARSQVDAMVQRLELVKREELDAVMEVARRAREGQEALEARVRALEARLAGTAAGSGESASGAAGLDAAAAGIDPVAATGLPPGAADPMAAKVDVAGAAATTGVGLREMSAEGSGSASPETAATTGTAMPSPSAGAGLDGTEAWTPSDPALGEAPAAGPASPPANDKPMGPASI